MEKIWWKSVRNEMKQSSELWKLNVVYCCCYQFNSYNCYLTTEHKMRCNFHTSNLWSIIVLKWLAVCWRTLYCVGCIGVVFVFLFLSSEHFTLNIRFCGNCFLNIWISIHYEFHRMFDVIHPKALLARSKMKIRFFEFHSFIKKQCNDFQWTFIEH